LIIETKNLKISIVEDNDILNILQVYNSNTEFLEAHMGKQNVDVMWLEEEIKSMKESDFYSCKIVHKKTKKIIGILDFTLKEECYLSLLMLHSESKNKGYGKEIYSRFEGYAKDNACKTIRIDVVTNYNDNVLNFWKMNNFKIIDNIELNWTGKILPAAVMKKYL
jgi:GNAT superfamily N-acetyltransferase